ncbi:unnamed protein product, partial [Effrenium voratum]
TPAKCCMQRHGSSGAMSFGAWVPSAASAAGAGGPYGAPRATPRQPGPQNQAAKAAFSASPGAGVPAAPAAPFPVGRVEPGAREKAQKEAEEAAKLKAPAPTFSAADLEKRQLVEKLRKLQASEAQAKVLWWSFCKVHAGGEYDPTKHDSAFLLTFFESYERKEIIEEPGCPPHLKFQSSTGAAGG